MKRWKSLTAALCAVVLLCGFSVPAYERIWGYDSEGDSSVVAEHKIRCIFIIA